jgi:hypothetical protein
MLDGDSFEFGFKKPRLGSADAVTWDTMDYKVHM